MESDNGGDDWTGFGDAEAEKAAEDGTGEVEDGGFGDFDDAPKPDTTTA